MIALRSLLQPLGEITGHTGCEFAISGVRQPDATWNIGPRFVAPKGSFRQILRSWNSRQHIDERSRMAAPDRFCLVRPYNLDTAQCSRRRRPIVFEAIAIRFRHLGCSRPGRGREDHDKRTTDGCRDHGRFESVSAVIGMSVSSRIGML